MITFLIKLLTVILLLLSLLIALVGGLYVLSTELQWLLDVDVLHKTKMKVRAWAYAESKKERKTLVRMFRARKGRGKSNFERLQTIKKRLCYRKNNREAIKVSKNNAKKKT